VQGKAISVVTLPAHRWLRTLEQSNTSYITYFIDGNKLETELTDEFFLNG